MKPQHDPLPAPPYPEGISESEILNWANTILESRFKRSNYLNSPDITREYLSTWLAQSERERFALILLDNQNGVIHCEVLFEGTIDGAAVYPREIVKTALAHNAAAVVLAHNHPSGWPEPSMADRRITERIVKALETVDIRVLDHLVIGSSYTVSFAERGLI